MFLNAFVVMQAMQALCARHGAEHRALPPAPARSLSPAASGICPSALWQPGLCPGGDRGAPQGVLGIPHWKENTFSSETQKASVTLSGCLSYSR